MNLRVARATAAALVSAILPLTVLAQQPQKASGAVLTPTTSSSEAKAAFEGGLADIADFHFARAAKSLDQALQLDPDFGVARVLYSIYAPALTPGQRAAEAKRGMADAANASTPELLFAAAMRKAGVERAALLEAAARLVPDDPYVSFYLASTIVDPRQRAEAFDKVARRFADFAPTYNQLAYTRARELGDFAGGMKAVERYVQLRPDHPNTHDSYAELLQWQGRLTEAEKHYQRALELDAGYMEGHNGLAEVYLLQNDGNRAREQYERVLAGAATPQAELNVRQRLAFTHVNDGNVKAALADLRAVAAEAEQKNFPGVATQAHQNLAIIEAALGDASKVDGHLMKAEALSTASNLTQRGFATVAHAVQGHAAMAESAVQSFVDAANASDASSGLKRSAHALQAMVAAAKGDVEAAIVHADQAKHAGALAKALIAEKLHEQGKRAEARALADQVRGEHQIDLLTLVARQRVKKL